MSTLSSPLAAVTVPVVVALLSACGGSRAPLPPPASDRSPTPALAAPEPRPSRLEPPSVPPVHGLVLENGIRVWIVERHGAPVVYAALAGRAPHTIGEGASPELDALVEHALGADLPSGLDDLDAGAHAQTRVHERGLTVVRRAVSDDLERTLRRFARIAEGRVFEDGEVARARRLLEDHARFQRRLQSRRSFPLPGEELMTRLYGEGDPRVRRSRLRARTLSRLDEGDVRRRLGQLLPPEQTALVLVGDVDPGRAEALVRRHLGGAAPQRVATPAARAAPPTFPEPSPRLMLFPAGREPNAYVRLIERGPPRDHPDHPAFRLYVRMAGGMFSSRLNLELREQRGETYGVMSRVVDLADHALFEISVVVPVAAVDRVAATIVGELSRLCDARRITSEEMSLARTIELARLSAALDTSAGLGEALVAAHLAGEGPESIERVYRAIEHTTPADVAEVGCRWVRPDHAPMIVVGDYRYLVSHPFRVPGGVGFIAL